MTKIRQFLFILLLFGTIASFAGQENTPQPLITIDLAPLVPETASGNSTGAVAFVSDHVVAAGLCFKDACNLAIFELAGREARKIGELKGAPRYRTMLRTQDGGLLLAGVTRNHESGAVLVDQRLQRSQWLARDSSEYRALFDHVSDVDVGNSAHRNLRRLKKPKGALGERVHESEDGKRLLWDSFVRRVGAAQSVWEKALVLPTMGMSTDELTPNREIVRVVDTSNRHTCFEWGASENLLPPFSDHADIDPTGHVVAIMTRATLSVFSLRGTCAGK